MAIIGGSGTGTTFIENRQICSALKIEMSGRRTVLDTVRTSILLTAVARWWEDDQTFKRKRKLSRSRGFFSVALGTGAKSPSTSSW